MLFPLLGAAIAGAVLSNRSQPRTRCERKVVLGARTGRTYNVEEFPEAGFLVVRAPDGAYGVFQHATQRTPADPRFSWRGGKGAGESLHGMCCDMGLVKEQQAASSKQQAPDPDPAARSPQPAVASPKPQAVPNNVVQHPSSQKTGS